MNTVSTIEILERLVGFPTVSRNSNRPLIDWVRNYLADYSVESHLVPDATGAKANLFASFGPAEEGGVVLSGHTDVVPIDGQHWSSDPFALTERESRLHGRGACDMKGFIAAALSRVPVWRDVQLDRPVHLMFSYDEEVGCLGAPSMIEAAKALLPEPAVVIVGEPTGMRLATEHKGIWTMCTRVRGVEAHSSLTHQGVSAVMLAAELIAHLGELAVKRAAQERTTRFEPPYTTMSVNRIEGGTAVNILAAACEFLWDIRAVPGDSPEAILEQLAAFARARLAQLSVDGRACSVETEVLASVPPLEARRGDAEDLVRTVLAQDAKSVSMPFATEAGQFQRAGWSSIVCGPGCIDQAHKANEFIERSQLDACEAFLDSAIRLQCMRKS